MNETNGLDNLSASIKSRIPRFLRNLIKDYKLSDKKESIEQKRYFWQKFGTKNLNGKQSRIPVFQSKTSINTNNNINDKYLQNKQKYKTNNCFDNRIFEVPIGNCLLESTNTEPNDDFKVKLRAVVGRSKTADTRTHSEPIDCLKYILEIVRSNSSADNKFRAIKRYRDKRLAIIHQMETFNDNSIDDRVSQWIDRSGYITANNRSTDDVFNGNQSVTNASHSMINQRDLMSRRRRSYNSMRAMDLIAMNSKYNSFNSELSSLSSIDSLLESRREDPEELLLALGFGYQSENQAINRIPQRFFESPSSAKGVNPDNVRNTFGATDIPSLSSSASFPSSDFRERSYSCGRISERFQKRLQSKESIMKTELPEIITSSCSSSLQSPQSESILNAANRKFLESQGKEQQNQLSSKRLIIGTKSYKLDVDGDPLAFPKTPSPVATTPVPPETEMEVSSQTNDEQNNNFCDNNNEYNLFRTKKRNPFQRQNCISDQEFNYGIRRHSINDLSSDLSSSTTTLVGTVVSSSNETPVHSSDYLESDDRQNTFSQSNCQSFPRTDSVAEAAIIVAIESLRLSLDMYRHQSIKMAKISSQKYMESSNEREGNESDCLSRIQDLRESIHKEIVEMDIVLNRHLQSLHSCDAVDLSFISQAQVFTEAIKKVRQLLKEQHNLYSQQMGFI